MLNPSTIMLGSKIASVVGIYGTDIIGKTLTTTTKSIVNVIIHLTTNEYPNSKDVRSLIFELDIEIKMKIIKALVDELNNNNIKNLHKYVKISLDSLTEITEKIHFELKKIKEKIDYHNSLYFNNWRTLNCESNLINIKKYNNLLDKRIDLLTKMLSIKF